jgi:hypothetical protein
MSIHPHPRAPAPVEVKVADCGRCRHHGTLLAEGRCQPGDICVVAESGRQIDRFLRRNPELAADYLQDAFWERRAIAVRYAPAENVTGMAEDPDEVVRRAVALRLQGDALLALRNDSDREVRITVAARLPAIHLHKLMDDPDYQVRVQVARRIPHGKLPRLADDPEREVRKEVARRLPGFALSRQIGRAHV